MLAISLQKNGFLPFYYGVFGFYDQGRVYYQGSSPGGWRTGYGGGFYDRTLATLSPKPVTAGLGYTNGWLPDMEPEPHDEPLDALLNDNGVVWPV
mgnify:CR=1 FL=1